MIEKTAQFLSNIKTIYATIFILSIAVYNVATWAGDQRYVQITRYEKSQLKREIRLINGKIAEYKIRLQYATEPRQKDMLKQLIIEAEKDKENLKGE